MTSPINNRGVDSEVLTDGATTTILVGGGVGSSPVWTTATGTGAPARAGTPSFTTTIGVGAATAAASGAGVTFPTAQSASTDANTLDDYEEGTWTVTLAGSATAGTQTYTGAVGTYAKVGQLVFVQGWCHINAKDGATAGNMLIRTLPFTSQTTASSHQAVAGGLYQWDLNVAGGMYSPLFSI